MGISSICTASTAFAENSCLGCGAAPGSGVAAEGSRAAGLGDSRRQVLRVLPLPPRFVSPSRDFRTRGRVGERERGSEPRYCS
jgi:hypothetical protein